MGGCNDIIMICHDIIGWKQLVLGDVTRAQYDRGCDLTGLRRHFSFQLSFNYFDFVLDKSCFVHCFGMADGCKYYNTHELRPPLPRKRSQSRVKIRAVANAKLWLVTWMYVICQFGALAEMTITVSFLGKTFYSIYYLFICDITSPVTSCSSSRLAPNVIWV